MGKKEGREKRLKEKNKNMLLLLPEKERVGITAIMHKKPPALGSLRKKTDRKVARKSGWH